MADWIAAGTLAVREDASEVRLGEERLELTQAQRQILLALVASNGRTTRRSDLYDQAFGRQLATRSRAVDTHVARIRRVLGAWGDCIVTVGRVGYRLDLEALAHRNGATR